MDKRKQRRSARTTNIDFEVEWVSGSGRRENKKQINFSPERGYSIELTDKSDLDCVHGAFSSTRNFRDNYNGFVFRKILIHAGEIFRHLLLSVRGVNFVVVGKAVTTCSMFCILAAPITLLSVYN